MEIFTRKQGLKAISDIFVTMTHMYGAALLKVVVEDEATSPGDLSVHAHYHYNGGEVIDSYVHEFGELTWKTMTEVA